MFGTFRFVLAVMVLVTHIGRIEVVAGLAVWGFFMLSGFLMTAVLNGKYGMDAGGIARFAVSRSIRLFPTYWISIFLTALIILLWHTTLDPRLINGALALPTEPRDLFANIFIVGHTILGLGRISSALSASAWAVDVEILMYACSCIFLARSKRIAKGSVIALTLTYPLLWLVAKKLIASGETELANQIIYSFLPAALLPYTIGSWLWFARDEVPALLKRRWMAGFAWAGLAACALIISKASVSAAYLLSLPCLFTIIAGLADVRSSGVARRADDFLGRLSYPIYLSHWMCAYTVAVHFGENSWLTARFGSMVGFTTSGFFVVLGTTIAVASVFAICVEGPVERIRHSLARRNSNVPEPAL